MWVLHEVGAEAEGRGACWEARMTAGLLELAALRKSPIPADSENMIGALTHPRCQFSVSKKSSEQEHNYYHLDTTWASSREGQTQTIVSISGPGDAVTEGDGI